MKVLNCFLVKIILYFLNLKIHSQFSRDDNVFLNIIMTDLRDFGINQKSKSFYSIIEKCIIEKKKVNIVVPLVGRGFSSVWECYSRAFSRYIRAPEFNIVFVEKESPIKIKVVVLIMACLFFLQLRGAFVSRFNLAFLTASNYYRILCFYKVFDELPCRNWFGLTGHVELGSLRQRNMMLGRCTQVSALQFGQASPEQLHFKDYSIDIFFVYDLPSEETFKKLGVNVKSLIVCGSPEFEYYWSNISDVCLQNVKRVGILFIDQPIQDRSEYSSIFLDSLYNYFQDLIDDPIVDFSVKKHPRGSAFGDRFLGSTDPSDDIVRLVSCSHIVIGFYSNLCDLAILKNRVTFCLKAGQVLSREKLDWMIQAGCYLPNTINELKASIDRFLKRRSPILIPVCRHDLTRDINSSEVIISKMVNLSES